MRTHEREVEEAGKIAEWLQKESQASETAVKDFAEEHKLNETHPDVYCELVLIEKKMDDARKERNAEKRRAIIKSVMDRIPPALVVIANYLSADEPLRSIFLVALVIYLYSTIQALFRLKEVSKKSQDS